MIINIEVLQNLEEIIKREKGEEFLQSLITTTDAYIGLARLTVRDQADADVILSTLKSELVKPDALFFAINLYAADRND